MDLGNYKKILIIGGAGFIGRNLAEALLLREVKVRIFDRKPLETLRGRCEFFEGDFTKPCPLEKAICGCDAIFHLASTALPKTSNEDPIHDISTNLISTVRILQISAKNGIKKIVYASSGGTVYGINSVPLIPEEHPTNPICSYGIVKLAAEKYLKLFYRLHGLESCGLRIANPYGRYQNIKNLQGVITTFCYNAINDLPIEIWGDGSVSRDFIFIDDVVDAMIRTLTVECRGEVLNIGSGSNASLRQIIEVVEKVSGRRLKVQYRNSRSCDVPSVCLDISRARKMIQWKPEHSLVDGVTKLYGWLESTKDNVC